MKVGNNYSLEKPQNNSNFGSLDMPKLADEIEKEKPFLEQLARDVDFFIHSTEDGKGISISLQAKPKSTGTKEINPKPYFSAIVPTSIENLGSKVYAKAVELKIKYIRKFKPIFPPDSKTPSVIRSLNVQIIPKTPSPVKQVL